MSPTIDRRSPNSITFQEMLDDIKTAFSRPDGRVDVDELWRVLESYRSDPNDWAKFAYYDMRKYKRNLVDEQDNYNVMILAWGPGTRSCIHDHSGSHCFMKMLDGELIESRYAWPEEDLISEEGQEMKRISESRVGLNEVLYINDKVGLHQVANPSMNRTSASLHVYIPPIQQCKAFDQTTGKARECKLSFYSKRGEIVKEGCGSMDC